MVFEVHAMQQVWVELSGEGSRAHGPGLRMTLLSPQHPQVVHLAAKASAGDRDEQDSLQVGLQSPVALTMYLSCAALGEASMGEARHLKVFALLLPVGPGMSQPCL